MRRCVMSVVDRLRSIEVTSRTVAVCIIGLLLVAACVVVTAKNLADSTSAKPKSEKPVTEGKALDKPGKVELEIREKSAAKKAKEGTAEKSTKVVAAPEDPYAIIIRRNLFRPVQPGSLAEGPKSPPKTSPMPDLPRLPPMPGGPKSSPDVSEFKKNLAFTGLVEMPTGRQALLENLQSKETRFVGSGETAFGYRLVSISDSSVRLEKDGATFALNMGENKPDTEPGAKAGAPAGPSPPGGPGGPEEAAKAAKSGK